MKRFLSASLMMLMIASGILPFLPVASAADPANTHGHVEWVGNWDVTGNLTYDGLTHIHMNSGNVRVKNGGVLTLDNAFILFNSASNGQYGIVVEAGGTLNLKNGGGMTRFVGTFTYYCAFMYNSTIRVDKGTITYAGGVNPDNSQMAGCYVGTDNAVFDKLTAGYNTYGEMVFNIDGKNVMIRNSSFYIAVTYGVWVSEIGSVDVYDTVFKSVVPGVIRGVETHGTANLINDVFTGLASGVTALLGSTTTIKNCDINNNSQLGVMIDGFGTYGSIKDTTITDNWFGLIVQSGAVVDITGTTKVQHSTRNGLTAGLGAVVNADGTQFRYNAEGQIFLETNARLTLTNGYVLGDGNTYNIHATNAAVVNLTKTTIHSINNWVSSSIFIEYSSILEMAKSSIKGEWQTGACIETRYDGRAIIKGSTITDCYSAYSITSIASIESIGNTFPAIASFAGVNDGSSLMSRGDTSKSSFGFTAFAQGSYGARLEFHNGDFTMDGNPVGMCFMSQNSQCDMYDTKFTAPNAGPLVVGDSDSSINAINVTSGVLYSADRNLMQEAIFNIGWHVDAQAQWQSGAPVPGANFKITDKTGDVQFDLVANDNGMVRRDLIQNTYTATGLIEHNNYRFTAEINGMSASKVLNISKDRVGPGRIIVQINDSAVPELAITDPAQGLVTSLTELNISGTASDVGSGLEGVYIAIDGSTTWAKADGLGTWTKKVTLTEGDHVIHAQARDVAGRTTDRTINLTVDLTAPQVVIVSPAALYQTEGTFHLTGTVNDENAAIKVDGTVVNNNNGTFDATVTFADGEHNITVEATDAVGNTGSAFKIVIVDTVDPTITSDLVQGTWLASTEVTVTGRSDGIQVAVNGKDATMDLVNKTWKVTLTLTEGANILNMTAKDIAGNSKNLKINVSVDTTKPVLSVTAPAGVGPLYTNKATVNVTGKVVESNLLGLSLGTAAVTVDANGNFTQTVTLAEGSNGLILIAKDLAGNEAKWEYTAILDTKAPIIEITSPKNGLVTNAASVQVIGKVDDIKASLKFGTDNVTNSNGTFTAMATLTAGANTITVTATDLAGNSASATITVTQDTACQFAVTKPTKMKVSSTKDSTTLTGTSEPGATVYVNGAAIPVGTDGSFTYKLVLKEGKNTFALKAVDAAGNEKSDTLTVTYTDEKQFAMSMLLIMGIVFMIIGLVIGLVVGMVMAKRKAPPPAPESEYPKAPTKSTKKPEPEPEEERPFSPEEEPEEEPAPVEKGSLKDKQKDAEVKPTETDSAKPTKTPEPKPETKPAQKTPTGDKKDDSLENLLKGLEKKK